MGDSYPLIHSIITRYTCTLSLSLSLSLSLFPLFPLFSLSPHKSAIHLSSKTIFNFFSFFSLLIKYHYISLLLTLCFSRPDQSHPHLWVLYTSLFYTLIYPTPSSLSLSLCETKKKRKASSLLSSFYPFPLNSWSTYKKQYHLLWLNSLSLRTCSWSGGSTILLLKCHWTSPPNVYVMSTATSATPF